jgi:hypothetical protein
MDTDDAARAYVTGEAANAVRVRCSQALAVLSRSIGGN